MTARRRPRPRRGRATLVVGLVALSTVLAAAPAVAETSGVVPEGPPATQEWAGSKLAATAREKGQALWGKSRLKLPGLATGLKVRPGPRAGRGMAGDVEQECGERVASLASRLEVLTNSARATNTSVTTWAAELEDADPAGAMAAAVEVYEDRRAAYGGAPPGEAETLVPGLVEAYEQVWEPFEQVDARWPEAAEVKRVGWNLYQSSGSRRLGFARWVDQVGDAKELPVRCRSTRAYATFADTSNAALRRASALNASTTTAFAKVKEVAAGLAWVASRVRPLPGAGLVTDHRQDVPARARGGSAIEGPEQAVPWTSSKLRAANVSTGGKPAIWGRHPQVVAGFTERTLPEPRHGAAPARCTEKVRSLGARLAVLHRQALALEKAAVALDAQLAPARPEVVMRTAAGDYHRARAAWERATAAGAAGDPAHVRSLQEQMAQAWHRTWAPLLTVEDAWAGLKQLTGSSRARYESTAAGLETGGAKGGFGNWYSRVQRDLVRGRCTADATYPTLLAQHGRVVRDVVAASTRTMQLLDDARETARDQAWTASRVKAWPGTLPPPDAPAARSADQPKAEEWEGWIEVPPEVEAQMLAEFHFGVYDLDLDDYLYPGPVGTQGALVGCCPAVP